MMAENCREEKTYLCKEMPYFCQVGRKILTQSTLKLLAMYVMKLSNAEGKLQTKIQNVALVILGLQFIR